MTIKENNLSKEKVIEYVYKNLTDKHGQLTSMKFVLKSFKSSPEREYIINNTQFLDTTSSLSERIYCLEHDITEKKICICGKNIQFLSNIKGYRKSCRNCSKKNCPSLNNDGKSLVKYKDNCKQEFINFLNSEENNDISNEEIINFINERLEKIKKYNTSDSRGYRGFVRSFDYIENKRILKKIIELTNDVPLDHSNYKFSQRIYNISHNTNCKKCEICKNEYTSFKNFFLGYNKVCIANRCAYKLASDNSTKNHFNIIKQRLEEQGFKILDEDPLIRISKTKVKIKCIKCDGIFDRDIADGDWKNLICRGCYCPAGISYEEKSVTNFVKELYSYEILENQRIFDDSKKELDIFIPERKLAIEYNGHVWHSFGNKYPINNLHLESKGKYNHIEKYKAAKERDISLLQICSTEWINENSRDIWKSIIKSKLGITTKIFARKCEIVELTNKEKNDFLNKNHLQGMDNSKIRLGLKYNNHIICIMTFSKPRFNKKYEWEMVRFCGLKNHTIVGGASKLFKHFIKKYNPKNVLSYADLRYSNGNVYTKIGFKYIHNTPPSYFYVKREKKVSRFTAQKHKQHNLLENYDPSKTEVQNMMDNDYRRVWDCGTMLFVYQT
jgi:hypothetical protein